MTAEAVGDDRLAELVGHRFAQPALLVEALTHSSAVPNRSNGRRRGCQGYERLEFLGDRVLGLTVADMLWRRFPDEAEGPLTRRHAQLVRKETLAAVAREIGLADHIRLSAGEASAQTRHNESLLADVCEAVIGALYIDGGLTAAERFIRQHWEPRLAAASKPPRDPKTALQEWTQARGYGLPRYQTVRIEGPPHRRVFVVAVEAGELEPAQGSGTSRRGAEAAAAAALLDRAGVRVT